MLTAILAFINMIPGISSAVTAVTNAYFNSKVQLVAARIGGDTTIAKAMVSGISAEGQVRVNFLEVVSHSKFLQLLIFIFAAPIAAFMAKCIVWDTMLGWGSTPELHGQVATLMNIIVTGIFGSGSVMAVGQMFFNRNKAGQ